MMDIFLKERDKDGNYDYRARMSVAWDYPECMYYLRPFRDVFPKADWNTYWILKYQNWNTMEREPLVVCQALMSVQSVMRKFFYSWPSVICSVRHRKIW